ncbi:bifunctional diguanylate cyclase/phosphodiesterase [Bacillus sp. SG-1]|uniref:bifunctional diguanylate cyclase/phosphodiesterase n=1 Tax=Bacillus sp. SG-1 TaxID=161544 RepID=UPI0002E03D3F|nr:EAL domain-containing protein [Bacillus sp. SG-1]
MGYKTNTSFMNIVFIVVFIQIVQLILGLYFPVENFFNLFIQIALTITTLSLVYFMLKGIFKTTKELSESNQKLNHIFESVDVAIWSHDLKSNNLLITQGIEKLYGREMEDFYKDFYLWKKVILPEDLQSLEGRQEVLQNGETCTSTYRITKPDGNVRWIQDRGIPTLDEKGNLIYFSSVLFDITDRKESEDQYRSLVEMSPDIIAVIRDGKFVYMNAAGSRVLGAKDPDSLIGEDILKVASEKDVGMIRKSISEYSERVRAGNLIFEIKATRFDGVEIDAEVSAMPILYGSKPAIQIVGRDITERKKTEETIREMAYYDTLTSLPNRNMFKLRLNKLLESSPSTSLAILFLDLDRFKVINDTKGHSTGDRLLVKVADRLTDVLNKEGEVFRQGGDEFILLLDNSDKEKAASLSVRILQSFTKPIDISGQDFFVTPSIGISMYPDDGMDQETLIKHADTAMYLAKDRGKNNFQFYNRNLNRNTTRKMDLENELRKALELQQLVLFYQPKVNLETGEVLGVEALIRWEHPTLGMVSPAEFIPLAEETGLIVPIGKWVLWEACRQSKEWKKSGIGCISVAVNISVRQLQDDDFVQHVQQAMKDTGLEPSLLELEITESIMQDFEKSSRILNKLKNLGVTISIDDFGTGYSSLTNLRFLPIDHIKIDKSFVDDIIDHSKHSKNGSIVKTIIDLGHNMNFNIIAEGVEEEEQVDFLLQNSCSIGQGYFYSRPLPPEQLEAYIRESQSASTK